MFVIGASICGIARMCAKLHVDIRAVPAHIMAFYSSSYALGTYHHQVADGQRTVRVAAVARTDGSVSGIT